MAAAIHSFSQQEMMAYLDGELSPKRSAAAAQHLEQCRECQRLVSDFQDLSQTLLAWETEPVASTSPDVKPEAKKKWKLWQRPSLATASALSVLFLISLVGLIVAPHRQAKSLSVPTSMLMPLSTPQPSRAPSGVLIIRTAELSLSSNNLDHSRAAIERIAKSHQGYISQLEFITPGGAARTLSAILRVPAPQLDGTLEELRSIGHVDSESQRGEDVTQRYVDVNARLANLRITEERLQQILRDHTGKLSDVLQVEEAIDRTRGEIEVTEAEQKMLSGQIAFATVNVRVSEDYQTSLGGNQIPASTRLRNAAVQGYRNVAEGALAVLVFILSAAPALFLIISIAFYPARWLWLRRKRPFS